ncbi:TetR/AcrR family transcriptional regulator [Levilactobacillus namurensis]|uniref:TetR/AcrR family transcriptional regulator n=1 Tax=Levilactobacillus namurensis TaxID=380393 RepID=UPI0004639A5B|nr:TetR/AcrR family transcriptional regulator [Levilactobacillus namurensis]MCW3778315.1 TetR/AcrR family transcriptional regulator [Levilactobacillus namurensis]MDT7019338.1 TetR/AcrR family transcriptional regulator [Levilactobacillus namurensis]WNN66062.1 TetR/AcrR family transcriptional regulator [Levilactobacillus namurensis]
METNQTTDERILAAFSALILKYGYQGATTRKIAATAGINESTVFRHYQDKHSILTELVATYLQDIDQIDATFCPTGDIEVDLQHIADLYATFVRNHQAVFLLGLRDAYRFPEISHAVKQLPMRLKDRLTVAFQEMVRTGEINAQVDVKHEVSNFILINYGNVVFNAIYPHDDMGVPTAQFVAENVKTFAQHLK